MEWSSTRQHTIDKIHRTSNIVAVDFCSRRWDVIPSLTDFPEVSTSLTITAELPSAAIHFTDLSSTYSHISLIIRFLRSSIFKFISLSIVLATLLHFVKKVFP